MVIDPSARISYRELETTTRDLAARFVECRRREGHPGRADHAQLHPLGSGRDRADPHRRGTGSAEHPAAGRRARRAAAGRGGAVPGQRRGIPRPPLSRRPRSAAATRTSGLTPGLGGRPTRPRCGQRASPPDRRRHDRNRHRRRPAGHHVHLRQQRSAQGRRALPRQRAWAPCSRAWRRAASPPIPACICPCRSSGWAASAAESCPRCWPGPPW